MTDAFALLEFPRQPWLEPDALKTAFLERSTVTHPDKFMDTADKDSARPGLPNWILRTAP